jgi:hypothetical protein
VHKLSERMSFSAAAGTAGALLHAREHEALAVAEIDGRGGEHLVRPLFQEYPESVLLEGQVARLGGFGYVHSQ